MGKREILVWVEQREGKLLQASREAAALGRHLANIMEISLAIVLNAGAMAHPREHLDELAGEEVWVLNPEIPGTASAEVYVEAFRQLVSRFAPRWILTGHSARIADFVPRLAIQLDSAYVPGCLGFQFEQKVLSWIRPVFEGKYHQRVVPLGQPPFLVTLQPGAFARLRSPGREGGTVRALPWRFPANDLPRRRAILPADSGQGVDLERAQTVVAGGKGMGSREQFGWIQRLAGLLGGAVGASRPAVEAGWATRDCQIGSSGHFVSPRLLLSCGISGAIHHVVGASGADCVVAINQDPCASIFRIADYGIVGRVEEILPALIEELERQSQDKRSR
jgi:electron transfer flavoprotein alpha subunit